MSSTGTFCSLAGSFHAFKDGAAVRFNPKMVSLASIAHVA